RENHVRITPYHPFSAHLQPAQILVGGDICPPGDRDDLVRSGTGFGDISSKGALVINTGLALDIQVPSPIPDKVRISLQKIYKLSRLFLSSPSLAQGQDISYKSLQLAASPNDDHRNTCRP